MTFAYNINFDIAALLFLIVIYFTLKAKYTSKLPQNIIFKRLTFGAIILTFADIISVISLSVKPVNQIFALSATALYYTVEAICLYIYNDYVQEHYGKNINKGNSIWIAANMTPVGMFILCIIINFISPIIFSIGANGELIPEKLHAIVYIIPMYYFVLTLVMTLHNRKMYSFSHIASMTSFVLVAVSAIGMQTFFPEYLLSCFGIAISILIMLITLETPDFQKLEVTLKELEIAKEEAMQANIAKSSFLANMSHEIRTPINGVLGMNEIILKSEPTDEIRECAENIESAGRSLLAIVNDILDLSKIESGKMEIINGEYSPLELINNVYHMMIFRAKDKNLEFKVNVDPNIPSKLFGDEIRIRQILINIISNAIKYTNKGEIAWKMWAESDVHGVTTLCISVSDTGIGIKSEDIPSLFEAYKRVDNGATKSIEGTGLGLRITKQLVDLIEGEITVDSTYGLGSIFTVRLPQSVIDETPMGAFSPRRIKTEDKELVKTPDFSGYEILVVDDIQVNLKVVKGLIKATNIKTDTALSGAEALELMKAKKYDIIFMDHLMPDMDGVETYAESKKMPENKNLDTPTVMLTANAILGAKEEYVNSGFSDYLTKPVKGQELIDVLSKYLSS